MHLVPPAAVAALQTSRCMQIFWGSLMQSSLTPGVTRHDYCCGARSSFVCHIYHIPACYQKPSARLFHLCITLYFLLLLSAGKAFRCTRTMNASKCITDCKTFGTNVEQTQSASPPPAGGQAWHAFSVPSPCESSARQDQLEISISG